MKLLDVNLLIYASHAASPHHDRARDWLTGVLVSGETVAVPWAVQLAFIRLTTNPRILDPALTSTEAIAIVEAWRSLANVTTPEPTSRHLALLGHLLAATSTAGNMVSDAHLAALAIEHGATLCSADADFRRFPGLEWFDPLQPGTTGDVGP